ncbi:DUF559 domain-containing protein [Sphingobium sp. DEHP117]|uniref:endonuclease domain-containing protein n=1 Tax=Sphingobium sp. DEHP117 TaxID=2993436 RepID=UPI0027D68928|nr:DUF559 domain-containing protein [Sphingobium sp. DEHP117]MDQ4421366.1 DUF559 domain-containing protein [Sphingobium sp. DEHP117]
MTGLTPSDQAKRLNTPPQMGRGRGWGLSAGRLEELHRRAAEMRRNPTEPERRLWRHLSASQLDGFKFRRQAVIGASIADFYCPAARLVVEVDGDTHDANKDQLRDDRLGAIGLRVVRVSNHDVMTNMEGVLRMIAAALRQGDGPHPNPSPEGEGLEMVEAQKLLGISLEGSVG